VSTTPKRRLKMSDDVESEFAERIKPKHDKFKDINIHDLETTMAKTVSEFMEHKFNCNIMNIEFDDRQENTIIRISLAGDRYADW
jgi:hypothetical protein